MDIEISVSPGKEIALWVECALCRTMNYIVLDMVPPVATPGLVFLDGAQFQVPGSYICEEHNNITINP